MSTNGLTDLFVDLKKKIIIKKYKVNVGAGGMAGCLTKNNI